MKILHISDLHIGKVVNRFSMLEDQKYILNEILRIAEEKQPQAVIIAGDIYDRNSPNAEAVAVFDNFLYELTKRADSILIISGNHDSAERIAFASRLLGKSGVYISPVYNGEMKPVTLTDEYGEINFYLMPFMKPAVVRNCFEGETINDYNAAVETVIRKAEVDYEERNVLVLHQFMTNAALSGSEERSVGGTENVDTSVVAQFDYTALGHIHRAQSVGAKHIRYCGSPLKYSFDEAGTTKSVCMVTLGQKGDFSYEKIALRPLREMRLLRGSFAEIIENSEKDPFRDDYVKVILTDEKDIPDAVKKLRSYYKNIMLLSYDNERTKKLSVVKREERITKMAPMEIFEKLFEEQNGKPLDDRQKDMVNGLIKEIWG